MNRRKFIKGSAALGALGFLYTWQIEPFWLEFIKLEMPIKHLPKNLIGSTLMQISDIHVGNRFDRTFITDSFEKAKHYTPDFVVYTGDFIHYESDEQLEQLEEVMDNVVLGKLGTVAVLGNHDYGIKWKQPEVADKVTQILESKGLVVLRNQQQLINGINFIGIDDYWSTNYYPNLVMDHIDPNVSNLVLCHNPDVADEPIWDKYQGWILSGHTHGGQCKPPFLPPPIIPVKNERYTAGKIELTGNRNLYINRALGHLWQVRFNVRPEITLFELNKA